MKGDDEQRAALIRVLIVDDHPAVRQGLGFLMEPEGIIVCAEAATRAEALTRAEACRPDVTLVDLALGHEDGLDLLADLHVAKLASLVYSMYEDGWHVARAFAAGARGYVTKSEIHGVLVQAINEVAAGGRFVSPKAALALAIHAANAPAEAAFGTLSPQEQHVYRFLGMGRTTREIAVTMSISVHTVESYYARMQEKLNIHGMSELRRHAIDHLRRHRP